MIRNLSPIMLAFALMACAEGDPVVDDQGSTVDQPTADVAIIPELEAIDPASVGIDFDETFGVCTFATGGETLLVSGTTGLEGSEGVGVVSMSGERVMLEASGMGGPDALSTGAMLFSGDYTVEIDRSGNEDDAAMESRSYEATMTLRKDGSSEVVYGPGTWECTV